MSFLEQHWWIGVIGSVVSAAAMVIAPIVALQQLLPLDIELGNSLTQDYLLAGGFAALFFVLVLMFASFVVRGRRRAHLRADALRGNLAVMPLSLLPADAQKAPDVSLDPLVLSWRAGMIQSAHSALVFLLAAVFWGFILVLVWAGLIINYSKFFAIVQEQWLPLAGTFVATPIYAALMVVLIRYLPTLFGKPFGITAASEGIHYRTVFGREGFIRWEELKLLEVEQYGLQSFAVERREFSLYGQNARQVVDWKDNPPTSRSAFVPNGMSQAEMTVRLQALFHLIKARTGLVPRTFSKALRSKEVRSATSQEQTQNVDERTKKSPQSRENAVTGVILAGITLAVAAAVILVPMSNLFVLSLTVVSSLGMVALILIIYAMRLVFQQHRTLQSPIVPPTRDVTFFSDVPESVYALSFGRPLRHRLAQAILGLLLIVNITPVLLTVMRSLFHVALPMSAIDSTASNPGGLLPFVVALYGVLGIMLLIAAFWPIKWTVRATRSALSLSSSMKHSTTLPWESIEQITARVRRGEVVAYTVVGDAGRTSITWFAEPSTLRVALPIDGTTPIAPDQLAALAAQRTGKHIEMVQA